MNAGSTRKLEPAGNGRLLFFFFFSFSSQVGHLEIKIRRTLAPGGREGGGEGVTQGVCKAHLVQVYMPTKCTYSPPSRGVLVRSARQPIGFQCQPIVRYLH